MSYNIKGLDQDFWAIIKYIRSYYILLSVIAEGMKPLKKTVSITLEVEVINGIKNLADENDRSFSAYINTVLKRILKNKAEQSQENKTE